MHSPVSNYRSTSSDYSSRLNFLVWVSLISNKDPDIIYETDNAESEKPVPGVSGIEDETDIRYIRILMDHAIGAEGGRDLSSSLPPRFVEFRTSLLCIITGNMAQQLKKCGDALSDSDGNNREFPIKIKMIFYSRSTGLH
jgi:hypothetical protein